MPINWSRADARPILPVASADRAARFYRAIGFGVELYAGGGYLFVRSGNAEIDLSVTEDFDPFVMAGMAYIVVDDPDALHAAIVATGLVGDQEILTTSTLRARWERGESLARISTVEDKPWGMREFALLDADNNLLRLGRAAS